MPRDIARATRATLLALLLLAVAGCTRRVAPGRVPPPLPPGQLALAHACGAPGRDTDGDALADACELALARAMAPLLVVDARDCLWRGDGEGEGRLEGAYLFAVAPRPGGGVRVAYLPAFTRDCGWSGWPCMFRGAGCGAHAGDSEVMALDLSSGGGTWRVDGIFLSAHCFGRSDGRCRWYRGDALDAFAWEDATARRAPRVWVARGKHALYPDSASCDTGHWGFDSCDGNDRVVRFPVLGDGQNVGSRARPASGARGCVAAARLTLVLPTASPTAEECTWDPARPFLGWQARPDGEPASSHARYLALLGFA